MANEKKSSRKPATTKPRAKRLSAANSPGTMLAARGKAPAKRRRKRLSTNTLHAGMNLSAMIKPTLMAVAGGVAGKILRNAVPDDLKPEIRAGAVAAAGMAAGVLLKQPMFAAGMIGSAGAFYIASIGEIYNIKLLKAPGQNTTYVRLAENQVYLDENGQPLICREGGILYRQNGTKYPYTASQMIQL